jgi:outer membrane receptor protein involved in Fe transport
MESEMRQFARFPVKPLAAAVSALSLPVGIVHAQEAHRADNTYIEEIVVLAARRAASVQDVPFNVAAVDSRQIEEQGMQGLADLAAWVPGLHVVDQGGRGSSRIVVRGLNANPARAQESLNNTSGGVVATYVGEIPLYVDLKLNDMDRVEVLLGPQGTLYGAGTLGGAIRYFPTKPEYETTAVELRGDAFGYSESDDAGYDVGGTVNIPFGANFAIRANVDYLDDPGFIDYRHLVREIGVSDPDPDLSDPDDVRANTKVREDANDEQTISGRIAARWSPTEAIDAMLTYYYQNQDVGARQISHHDGFGTSEYATAMRVLEPNERENELTALEITADLGFAELTSATGFSKYDEKGHRDQTDFLISLEFSYELFPEFTAFTTEELEEETFTQELRLLSTHEGPFEWILGAFYNDYELDALSAEYTPNFDLFAVDVFGGFGPRPDSLEYLALTHAEIKETAVYGELKWNITDAWQMTVGARWYDYDLETEDSTALPLCDTVFFGEPPDSI